MMIILLTTSVLEYFLQFSKVHTAKRQLSCHFLMVVGVMG